MRLFPGWLIEQYSNNNKTIVLLKVPGKKMEEETQCRCLRKGIDTEKTILLWSERSTFSKVSAPFRCFLCALT